MTEQQTEAQSTPTPDPNVVQVPGMSINKKLLQLRMVSGDVERLSYGFNLVHQQVGLPPVTIETRVSRNLENAEQAYVRHYKLDADKGWIDVDFGWVEHPGFFSIENRTGMRLVVQPTDEERLELTKRVVLIKIGEVEEPQLKASPFGGFQVGELNGTPIIRIKCVSGVANVTVSVIPC